MWTRILVRRARLKAPRKKSSRGMSLLSFKDQASCLGESAAVHSVQLGLLSFGDGAGKSDDDPAVVRTVETLAVAGSDVPASVQEKEARSSGGILSR
jgi:hypothetical protein